MDEREREATEELAPLDLPEHKVVGQPGRLSSTMDHTWSDRAPRDSTEIAMINTERAVELRSSLAADGYEMDIAESGDRVSVTIIATEQACADCLVPKDLMRGILGKTLGVDCDTIDLTYPAD